MGLGSVRCVTGAGQSQIVGAFPPCRLRTRWDENAVDGRAEEIDSPPVVKSLPVVTLEAVREDLQAAYDYFETRVAGAGERFLERYFQLLTKSRSIPKSFR